MSLYLADVPVDNRANKTLLGNSFRAVDTIMLRAIGAGVLSGLTIDSAGNLQIGEAAIGHVVALGAPISVLTASTYVITACAPNTLNYVFLRIPDMPSTVPAVGSAVGVVGPDGRDVAQVICNVSGTFPSNSVLLATVQTGAGNSVTAVNNAPTGRNNIILPSQVQAQILALKERDIFVGGSLPVQSGIVRWRVPAPLTVTQLKANLTAAPVGSSQIWDLKKNGVSVFSSPAGRLTIAAGAVLGASAAADNGAGCVEGDVLSIDTMQAGSTTPAVDFIGTIYFK